MRYLELLDILNENKELVYADFQRRLIPTKSVILGVRTPTMRKIVKEVVKTTEIEEILAFPDEYFETTFVKLTTVSALPYERFVKYVERCVELMDNWASCDCFKAKCLKKHKDEFLPVLERIFAKGGEFEQRYVLVVLLGEYMEEKYLPIAEGYISRANAAPYYVHMALAWLTAEILVKHYDYGVKLLQKGILVPRTHNKAIQKAIESYRLNQEQKEYLRSLKIKK